jgi:hypothetical protein
MIFKSLGKLFKTLKSECLPSSKINYIEEIQRLNEIIYNKNLEIESLKNQIEENGNTRKH